MNSFCIISTVSSSLKYSCIPILQVIQLSSNFLGPGSKIIHDNVSISSPPSSLEMKEQFLPKQSLGKVRSGGTFQSAIWKTVSQVQLPWPHAVLAHDASKALRPQRPAHPCARPHLCSTRHVVTLQVHNIKPPLLRKTAEALHCLAHFRLKKKTQKNPHK